MAKAKSCKKKRAAPASATRSPPLEEDEIEADRCQEDDQTQHGIPDSAAATSKHRELKTATQPMPAHESRDLVHDGKTDDELEPIISTARSTTATASKKQKSHYDNQQQATTSNTQADAPQPPPTRVEKPQPPPHSAADTPPPATKSKESSPRPPEMDIELTPAGARMTEKVALQPWGAADINITTTPRTTDTTPTTASATPCAAITVQEKQNKEMPKDHSTFTIPEPPAQPPDLLTPTPPAADPSPTSAGFETSTTTPTHTNAPPAEKTAHATHGHFADLEVEQPLVPRRGAVRNSLDFLPEARKQCMEEEDEILEGRDGANYEVNRPDRDDEKEKEARCATAKDVAAKMRPILEVDRDEICEQTDVNASPPAGAAPTTKSESNTTSTERDHEYDDDSTTVRAISPRFPDHEEKGATSLAFVPFPESSPALAVGVAEEEDGNGGGGLAAKMRREEVLLSAAASSSVHLDAGTTPLEAITKPDGCGADATRTSTTTSLTHTTSLNTSATISSPATRERKVHTRLIRLWEKKKKLFEEEAQLVAELAYPVADGGLLGSSSSGHFPHGATLKQTYVEAIRPVFDSMRECESRFLNDVFGGSEKCSESALGTKEAQNAELERARERVQEQANEEQQQLDAECKKALTSLPPELRALLKMEQSGGAARNLNYGAAASTASASSVAQAHPSSPSDVFYQFCDLLASDDAEGTAGNSQGIREVLGPDGEIFAHNFMLCKEHASGSFGFLTPDLSRSVSLMQRALEAAAAELKIAQGGAKLLSSGQTNDRAEASKFERELNRLESMLDAARAEEAKPTAQAGDEGASAIRTRAAADDQEAGKIKMLDAIAKWSGMVESPGVEAPTAAPAECRRRREIVADLDEVDADVKQRFKRTHEKLKAQREEAEDKLSYLFRDTDEESSAITKTQKQLEAILAPISGRKLKYVKKLEEARKTTTEAWGQKGGDVERVISKLVRVVDNLRTTFVEWEDRLTRSALEDQAANEVLVPYQRECAGLANLAEERMKALDRGINASRFFKKRAGEVLKQAANFFYGQTLGRVDDEAASQDEEMHLLLLVVLERYVREIDAMAVGAAATVAKAEQKRDACQALVKQTEINADDEPDNGDGGDSEREVAAAYYKKKLERLEKKAAEERIKADCLAEKKNAASVTESRRACLEAVLRIRQSRGDAFTNETAPDGRACGHPDSPNVPGRSEVHVSAEGVDAVWDEVQEQNEGLMLRIRERVARRLDSM